MNKESLNELLASTQLDEAIANLICGNEVSGEKKRYVELLNKATDLYGDGDYHIVSAPGRTEVGGNHTDHNKGCVVAASVNLDSVAVVKSNNSTVVNFISEGFEIKPVDLSDLSVKKDEVNRTESLIRGIAARFVQLGYKVSGFDATSNSKVLPGSGISSSASFEVLVGEIFNHLFNEGKINAIEIAQIAQYAENEYFGKPCGLMDQSACSVGSLIHIDFKDNSKPVVEKVDVEFSSFKHSLCIVDVHASHADLTDDYAAVPYEMKKVAQFFGKEVLREVDEKDFYNQLVEVRKEVGDRAILRAIHLFNENKRVEKAVSSLKNDDFDTFKQVIKDSGDSSYKYLQNVYSNKYPDNQAVSLALALSEGILENHGVCRVHGGGFAGTIQAFVEDEYVDHYKEEIEKYFGEGSCHVLKVRKFGGMKVL